MNVLNLHSVFIQICIKINKDILFAACILHDIGKIFEYKINFETGFVNTMKTLEKIG